MILNILWIIYLAVALAAFAESSLYIKGLQGILITVFIALAWPILYLYSIAYISGWYGKFMNMISNIWYKKIRRLY